MDNLILIPARGGSTRVRNKNTRLLGRMPLLAHVVRAAIESQSGRVIVSTNSESIAAVARDYGAEVPFKRPEHLVTATATSLAAILHALMWLKENENWVPQFIAFCPPTNPFIQPRTIERMSAILVRHPQMNSIVTVTTPKTHPFRIVGLRRDNSLEIGIVELEGKTIKDIERSQDWPEVWEGSPACRLSRSKFFFDLITDEEDPYELQGKTYDPENVIGYKISNIEAFDIDNEEDFTVAQSIMAFRGAKH